MKALENKIPPPLVMGLTMLVAWLFSGSTAEQIWVQLLVAALALFGLWLIRDSIMGFIKAKTTVNPLVPESASKLVTDGVFRFTRNPMYLAMASFTLAWSLYFTGYWGVLYTGFLVLFLTKFQIIPEEVALEKVFGADFLEYKMKVRRWI